MDKRDCLPFKVGQLVESRSFQLGYRGAWFRCKIKEISWKKGHIWHALEYFDFPDEKIRWTKLYQLPPIYLRKLKGLKRQLMVRPEYPSLYHESEVPQVSAISEAAVVFNGVQKVGDLVDWWTDGCFWSGRVTQILGNDKVQIELPLPPIGEGASYEACCKDLRPSLYWSPKDGWTIPTPMEGDKFHPCVRLIQPSSQAEDLTNIEIHAMNEGTKDVPTADGLSFNWSISNNSANSLAAPHKSEDSSLAEMLKQPLNITVPMELKHALEDHVNCNLGEPGTAKTSLLGGVSSSHVRDASAEATGQILGENLDCSGGCMKKFKSSGGTLLSSVDSDTLEAAILDLEELANKVIWLKGILEFGIPMSNSVTPQWKFVEHRPSSSTPK